MALQYAKVTGRYTLLIEDQIRDVDHDLDEVPLSGTVTFTPRWPKGMTQGKASEPPRLVSAKPVKALVSSGDITSLSGTVSEIGDVPAGPGQSLVSWVGDTPLWWVATFDVGYNGTPVVIPSVVVDLSEGDVDLTTLLSASGFPTMDTSEIEAVIADVKSMSRAAEDAIRRAEAAADAVGEVDAAAREAVRVAAESATAAETSAADSEASAVRAEAGADRVGSAEAVLDARDQATAAATTATGAAATATEQADWATTEADRAGSEADRATEQATAAAGSSEAAHADAVATAADRVKTTADATATAADRVATAADRTATGQARSQTWASADKAAGSATTATTQADRAESEADRASAAADLADGAAVQAVTERVDALLDGAPEAYDTLSEIAAKLADQDDVASAMTAQIGQKADTTDAYGKTVARYESGSSQWIEVGDNGYNGGDYMSGGALNLRSADSRYASKTDLATVKATAEAALPASMLQVVDAAPDDPTAGVFYFVRE